MSNNSSRKADVTEWLQPRGIYFSPTKTKSELLQEVPFRNHTRHYELGQLANDERGHQVIQLLPYHCQDNPIELVWAQMKREVVKKEQNIRDFRCEKTDQLGNCNLAR